jgi:hypothetical protein
MQQAKAEVEGKGGASVEFEAETVIAEVRGVYTGAGRSVVQLNAEAIIQAAAGSEKVTLRIRREGIAGQVVETEVLTEVASAAQGFSMQCEDSPGEVAGLTYVLTAQESKAGTKDKSLASKISAIF